MFVVKSSSCVSRRLVRRSRWLLWYCSHQSCFGVVTCMFICPKVTVSGRSETLCTVSLWKRVRIYAAVVVYAVPHKSVRHKRRNGVVVVRLRVHVLKSFVFVMRSFVSVIEYFVCRVKSFVRVVTSSVIVVISSVGVVMSSVGVITSSASVVTSSIGVVTSSIIVIKSSISVITS